MGKMQRDKGARWDRAMKHWFEEHIGLKALRGLQARGGVEVADVLVEPFWVECKHQKKPNLKAALEQAQRDCPAGYWPMASCKFHGQGDDDAIVVMPRWAFGELVKEWLERGAK